MEPNKVFAIKSAINMLITNIFIFIILFCVKYYNIMLILDKILRIYQFVYDFTTLEDTLQLKTIIFYILNLKNI